MKYLAELVENNLIFELYKSKRANSIFPKGKARINLLGVGDVGRTLLLALKLLGGDVIDHIGIYDKDEKQCKRIELEMCQMNYPFGEYETPRVTAVKKENLFDCDIFLFCASKEEDTIGAGFQDSKAKQLEEKKHIITEYGRMARNYAFDGIFAIISEPADQLCPVLLACGVRRTHIRGFGLGVMHSRALDIAKSDPKFADFIKQGRVFGPEGADLVVANSLSNYDPELSKELTRQTLKAHLKIRALGFKPYLAYAVTSGAISLIQMLRGEWHYSTLYLGTEKNGAFFGVKNKLTENGPLIEDIPMSETLYEQIETAFNRVKL